MSCRSCRDSNSQPFDYEAGALPASYSGYRRPTVAVVTAAAAAAAADDGSENDDINDNGSEDEGAMYSRYP